MLGSKMVRAGYASGGLSFGVSWLRGDRNVLPSLCGHEMCTIEEVVIGSGGYSSLGPRLQTVLIERFPEHKLRSGDAEVGRTIGSWSCTSCGVPFAEGAGCPSCGRDLRDLVFDLVELPPHRDDGGQW